MHIVKEARLYFREGTSDKVYELELQETSPGEYLVYFRYGRRGAALKEGAKLFFWVQIQNALFKPALRLYGHE